MKTKKEILPLSREITVKIKISDARKCLKYLPNELKKVKNQIEENLAYSKFWNFLRRCRYLLPVRADFHFTGLMGSPAWSLYCKHPKNKNRVTPSLLNDVPKKELPKITGYCDKKSCPRI